MPSNSCSMRDRGSDSNSSASTLYHIPDSFFEDMPRDCLLMMLDTTIKRIPQEAVFMLQCMQALGPLHRNEYEALLNTEARSSKESKAHHPSPSNPSGFPARDVTPADYRGRPRQHSAHDDHLERMVPMAPHGNGKRPWSPPRSDFKESMKHPAAEPSPGKFKVFQKRHRAPSKVGMIPAVRKTDCRVGKRTSILTEDQAIEIFKMRPAQVSDRTALCLELADRYQVTTTSIRHIWDRRTWLWTSMPYWTEEDTAQALATGLCDECVRKKVAAR
jgi:hypothetical protein